MITFQTLLASTIAVVLLPIMALGQSPDDLAVGNWTRGFIEESFRLKKGSLVIPSDGRAFQRAFRRSAWAAYAGVGMQLDQSVTLSGDPKLDPSITNELTILHRHVSGLYYQEIFVGNDIDLVGQLIAIVGISGNQFVGCNYLNITEPPSPLLPIYDGLPPCGPFLADLNDATCSYATGGATLAYDIVVQIIPGFPEYSKSISSRSWVSFANLDVFAERDPNGNEWPRWILDNRDEFYWEGYTSYPCTRALKRGKKWKKSSKSSKSSKSWSSKSWKKRGRKRTSRVGNLLGI